MINIDIIRNIYIYCLLSFSYFNNFLNNFFDILII